MDKIYKTLVQKHPELFGNAYINCDNGWCNIILELSEKLEKIKEMTGIRPVFGDVTEKWGKLLFCYKINHKDHKVDENDIDTWSKIIKQLIAECERTSLYVCKTCGTRIYRTTKIDEKIYTCCHNCLEKKLNRDNISELLEEDMKRHEVTEEIIWKLYNMDLNELIKVLRTYENDRI